MLAIYDDCFDKIDNLKFFSKFIVSADILFVQKKKTDILFV